MQEDSRKDSGLAGLLSLEKKKTLDQKLIFDTESFILFEVQIYGSDLTWEGAC